MAFRLIVSDMMVVPVKGSLASEKGRTPFSFKLSMRRLPREEYAAVFSPEAEMTVRQLIEQVTSGWSDQRLILDDNNSPATFSAEALAFLLDVVGMEQAVFKAYVEAYETADTAVGRRGN